MNAIQISLCRFDPNLNAHKHFNSKSLYFAGCASQHDYCRLNEKQRAIDAKYGNVCWCGGGGDADEERVDSVSFL